MRTQSSEGHSMFGNKTLLLFSIVMSLMLFLPITLYCGWALGQATENPDSVVMTDDTELQSIQHLIKLISEMAGDPGGPYTAENIDSFIIAVMDVYHIPGVAACVIKGSDVVWEGYYGYADIDNQIPVADSILFMLASISKTFVANALMQLWERELFELDDDINDYLPFPVRNPHHPDTPITFRQILSHTSSIARHDQHWLPLTTWGADSSIPLNVFLQDWLVPDGAYYMQRNYSFYPPGSVFEYSNVAFALAGYLAEVISGQEFEAYCQENLFGPLGMMETSWFLSELERDHIAVPTGFNGVNYYSYGQYGVPVYPCSQLRTSALQLARHLIAFMEKGTIDDVRVLDSVTVDLMMTVQCSPYPFLDWGLGWYRIDLGDGYMWGHNGGFYGVATNMYFFPEDETGLIVLTNGDSGAGCDTIMVNLFPFMKDNDNDGIINGVDNCPDDLNPFQEDNDADGFGNLCDLCPADPDNDLDGDGICGDIDNCPGDANGDQEDGDHDGTGDVCDNCPEATNPGQEDTDSDARGDICDPCPADPDNDIDGDGLCGDVDNCPDLYNPAQEDGDFNGIGDACQGRRGDTNTDGSINVLDVLAVVNHILGTDELEGDALTLADCNDDGRIDILDALGIVNVILGFGKCKP